MFKAWVSDTYEMVAPYTEQSKNQILQMALGQALMSLGRSYSLAAARGDIDIPKTIQVEVVEKGWDLQVILYMEGADVLSVELSNQQS